VSSESNEFERFITLSGLIKTKGELLESLDKKVLFLDKIEDIDNEEEDSSLIASCRGEA
jgi:hypothetical protein